ncbi:MAG TPA: HepT-like ribonuclease domain-containing protein [Xanthobacteraceae bacterium]|jgi:uncharacterized protein with HEPN domain|nr:HepT-like ribonuclease domain-containing protein [Xanthobacteraceae bacterium]
MADKRAPLALYHILDAVRDFLAIVDKATSDELAADRTRRYAAERCVEIISEASRRIPDSWKAEHPSIPWPDIAGIGNVLRHNYDDVNLEIVVKLRGRQLDDLERAVVALLEKYDPQGRKFQDRG